MNNCNQIFPFLALFSFLLTFVRIFRFRVDLHQRTPLFSPRTSTGHKANKLITISHTKTHIHTYIHTYIHMKYRSGTTEMNCWTVRGVTSSRNFPVVQLIITRQRRWWRTTSRLTGWLTANTKLITEEQDEDKMKMMSTQQNDSKVQMQFAPCIHACGLFVSLIHCSVHLRQATALLNHSFTHKEADRRTNSRQADREHT